MKGTRPLLAPLVAGLLAVACASDDDDEARTDRPGTDDAPLAAPDGRVRVTVRRTPGGVPHVRADDLVSVAYGAGHAQAEDNVCLIAEAIVKARGERARFFGPGEDDANVVSDFSYRALALGADVSVEDLSPESRALLAGFAAGYNRHVADTDPAELPPACRERPWVRPISSADLLAYYRIVAQYASGDLFASGALLAAVPPDVSPAPRPVGGNGAAIDDAEPSGGARPTTSSAAPDGDSIDGASGTRDARARRVALDPERIGRAFDRGAATSLDVLDTGLGSNAWGIGRALSEGGRGALLANPHFPYTGTRRLYQMHLTVPGYYDVNGAALIGTALPLTGFNRNVAWSHTVSAGRRFTLYELTLAEDDPLAYVKDGRTVPIRTETIRVEVDVGGATPTTLEREVYLSEYGPMLAADALTGGALPAWGASGTAYTYRDANASPERLLDTWLGLGRARDLESFRAVFEDCGSTLWTNTVYADDAGEAFYVDSSSVPALPAAAIGALETKIAASEDFARLFYGGLTLLDGSIARDDWVEGECGGLVPYAERPALTREDFVQNSNSSHWMTNPEEPLTGHSPLFGDEQFLVNARTRLGLRMLQSPTDPGFAASAPAGQDGRFGALELLETIWNDRALYAELWLPELRARCELIGSEPVRPPGGEGAGRSVRGGCEALAAWDGTYGVESVGAHVFRVFLARLFARDDLAVEPDVDPTDPASATFAFTAEGRGGPDDQLLQSLASALDALDASAVAYDAPLGSVQTWTPSGGVPPEAIGEPAVALADPIPWHGGDGSLDGAFNAVGVTVSPVAEDTRFPRLAPETRPDTGGLSTVPGEGWAIGRGTSWHFGLEFTDDGPEAYGLVSYSQSSDPRSAHFVDQSLAYSAKTPRRLLYDEEDIAANVLPNGERVLEDALESP